jgi:hypothetical protein
MGRIGQIGIKFWNQIVEIKKGKQNLNWGNMRMHQFLGSEMMRMERCKDAEMEKIIWTSSMEIQKWIAMERCKDVEVEKKNWASSMEI